MATPSDTIKGEMDKINLPGSALDTFLQALDAAGFQVAEKEGGTPVEVAATVTPVRSKVAGMPGVFLTYVDVGDGSRLAWLEFVGKDGVQRVGGVTALKT
ncbi:MAG: hypothetical protein ACREJO_12210 [Phycisphaerales bacterium]